MKDDSTDKVEKTELESIPEDGFLGFLSSKAGITKDVAIKTFGEITKLVALGTEAFSKMHNRSLDANKSSQKAVLEHESFVAQVYAEQLRLEELTPEQRAVLNQKLEDGVKRANEKDTENKDFILKLLKIAGTGVLTALALAVVITGAKSATDKSQT